MRDSLCTTVLAAAFLMAAGFAQAQQPATPAPAAAPAAAPADSSPCTQPTVDTLGKAEGVQYRYWLLRLQKAVKEDDRKAVAEFALYPLTWNRKDGSVSIKSRGELLKRYDEVFTPELKARILNQNVRCLPGDDEGANVGGELRFSKMGETNTFEITSITQNGTNNAKAQKLPWE